MNWSITYKNISLFDESFNTGRMIFACSVLLLVVHLCSTLMVVKWLKSIADEMGRIGSFNVSAEMAAMVSSKLIEDVENFSKEDERLPTTIQGH